MCTSRWLSISVTEMTFVRFQWSKSVLSIVIFVQLFEYFSPYSFYKFYFSYWEYNPCHCPEMVFWNFFERKKAIISFWGSNIDIGFVVLPEDFYLISLWGRKIVIGFVVVPDIISLFHWLQLWQQYYGAPGQCHKKWPHFIIRSIFISLEVTFSHIYLSSTF